jgi:hypothetical protein
METAHLGRRITLLCIIIILWVALFLWLGRHYEWRDYWALMLIGAALFTFFGILQLPANTDEKGAFSESRIRLAISATLTVSYLVYLGSVVYLDPVLNAQGNRVPTFADDLFPTLTNLLTVTISFYFGSTAAIEIAGSRPRKDGSKT